MNLAKIRINLIKWLVDLNERFFFERRLKEFYKRYGKISSVIDIGANKGQTIDFFLKLNPECKIYAIEPNPDLFKKLILKYGSRDNIHLYNIGISDSTGEKLFYENVFDYTSSFEKLNWDSTYLQKKVKILGVKKETLVKRSYNVHVSTLQDFFRENKILGTIDLLKVDTEGHEYYCLSGLFPKRELVHIGLIQIENHNDDMYSSRVPYQEIDRLLNENNFFEIGIIRHGFGGIVEVVYKKSIT